VRFDRCLIKRNEFSDSRGKAGKSHSQIYFSSFEFEWNLFLSRESRNSKLRHCLIDLIVCRIAALAENNFYSEFFRENHFVFVSRSIIARMNSSIVTCAIAHFTELLAYMHVDEIFLVLEDRPPGTVFIIFP